MDYVSQRAAEMAINKDVFTRAEEEELFRDACAKGEIYGVDKDDPEDWGEPYLDWLKRDTMERISRETELAKQADTQVCLIALFFLVVSREAEQNRILPPKPTGIAL